MNLFTYLLSKKGKNSLVHKGDLFAYLLGKQTPKEVKTATGTTISITDATKEKIVSLTLSKESTQDGTPTPENPVEIKTVKGYRNLFDKNNVVYRNQYILNDKGVETYDVGGGYTKMYIEVEPSTSYYISGLSISGSKRIYYFDENKTFISRTSTFSENYKKVITPSNCKYIDIQYNRVDNDFNKYMINKSDVLLPYVPYGTNWIYTQVSNGTNTNYYTIPLNNNEIVGKSTNLDELIIDKHGHCFINKKFAKIDSYNGETITTDYWSTTGGLDTGATVYYVLATPELIDLNYTVDLTLFEGVNNISNSDDMEMTLKYY